jgi:hypothetical protein
MEKKTRANSKDESQEDRLCDSHCLVCGKLSSRMICVLCAGRLRREALSGEISDEKQGKRPRHLSRS